MKRKIFLQQVVIGSGSLVAMPFLLPGQASPDLKQPKADQLPAEKVKDFVVAGHSDLTKVKSLLQEFPTLLYATWDWGAVILKQGWREQAMLVTKKLPIT
jgi:hypothetical protein